MSKPSTAHRESVYKATGLGLVGRAHLSGLLPDPKVLATDQYEGRGYHVVWLGNREYFEQVRKSFTFNP